MHLDCNKDLTNNHDNYEANNTQTSGRAAPVVNHKEIYFNAHIKMLNLYDDIPDQYTMQKMIYDDNTTLQDLINQLKKNQKMMLSLMIIKIKPLLPWSRMSKLGATRQLVSPLNPLRPNRGALWGLKLKIKNH